MVELPIGSLVGVGLIGLFLGVLIGRSSKFMAGLARRHAAVHTTDVTTGDTRTGDQLVNVMVSGVAQTDASVGRIGAGRSTVGVGVVDVVAQFVEPDGTLSPRSVEALDVLFPRWRAELAEAAPETLEAVCVDDCSPALQLRS